MSICFFFQAEDGIRDKLVTGVQTCALPICAFSATRTIHTGTADTVTIELTDLVRAWAQDTTAQTAFFLAHVPEAASFTEIRFYSSRAPGFRPALHITYVKRFPFGTP